MPSMHLVISTAVPHSSILAHSRTSPFFIYVTNAEFIKDLILSLKYHSICYVDEERAWKLWLPLPLPFPSMHLVISTAAPFCIYITNAEFIKDLILSLKYHSICDGDGERWWWVIGIQPLVVLVLVLVAQPMPRQLPRLCGSLNLSSLPLSTLWMLNL